MKNIVLTSLLRSQTLRITRNERIGNKKTEDMTPYALLLVPILGLTPLSLLITAMTVIEALALTEKKSDWLVLTPQSFKGSELIPFQLKKQGIHRYGLVAGEEVSFRRVAKDRYGRTVVELLRMDKSFKMTS